MPRPYLSLSTLLAEIDEPNQSACRRILTDCGPLFRAAPGSSHNHQAWPGGYLDHVAETMNVAWTLYATLNESRNLPFSLSDALLVLFLHDLEKPWKYASSASERPDFQTAMEVKRNRHLFRMNKLAEFGIRLTAEQGNALRYAEGEHADYSARHRVMGPLAAFCHMCDVASARLWPDHPLAAEDPWPNARRHGL